ncbi:TetR family transcriptional regulator [Ktedonospora formicarum]|uniref:TetR family transcriptional regulator n=2 Tax=Ktedonospora formicarum TaxID=2778364 RepID=A0A8J3I472_9CHLR|nr:TetR family transcriptional regulator [Ktedonospora formicarum]
MEREDLILQVAEDVLEEKGYYDTSMEEIATRVGIAKGTIYTHFSSKEELVASIFARDMNKFIQGIDKLLDSGQSPRSRLESLLNYFYDGLYSRRAKLLTSTFTGVDLKRLISSKNGSVHQMWDCIVSKVAKLIEEGKVAGEFRNDVSTQAMIFMILSIISPRVYDHVLIGDNFTAKELHQQLISLCFNGIISPEDK